jgi:hypothetical protein
LIEKESLRDEINRACNNLNYIDGEFKEVNDWEEVIREIEETFIAKKAHNSSITPYCEHLKGECFTLKFPDDNAFTALDKLIPQDEKVWLLAQDTNKIWLYEGYVCQIVNIIKECYAFEYYIVSQKYLWLLCENHHGCLIGIGCKVIERMKSFRCLRPEASQ